MPRRVAGSVSGSTTNFEMPTSTKRLDRATRARPNPAAPARSTSARSGRRWREPGEQRLGYRSVGVGDQRPEVLGIDRPLVLDRDLLDHFAPARPASSGVTNEGSQPSARRPTRFSSDGRDAAEPDVGGGAGAASAAPAGRRSGSSGRRA